MANKPHTNKYIYDLLLQRLMKADDFPSCTYGDLKNFMMKHGLVIVGEQYHSDLCDLKRSVVRIHELIQD